MNRVYNKGQIYFKSTFSKAIAYEGEREYKKSFGDLADKKTLLSEKVSEGTTIYRFIGSKEVVDRDGDIVVLDGMDTESYVKNPIVLWGHNHNELPIGKTVGLTLDKTSKELIFDIAFASTEKGREVESLVKDGILRATSIGFMVNNWEYEADKGVFLLDDTELFEISIVNVPANPEALAVGEDKGLETDVEVKSISKDEIRQMVAEAIESALGEKEEPKEADEVEEVEEVKEEDKQEEETPVKEENPSEEVEADPKEDELQVGDNGVTVEGTALAQPEIDYDKLAQALASAMAPKEEDTQPDVDETSEEKQDEDHNAEQSPKESEDPDELELASVESLELDEEIFVIQEEN